MSDLRALAEAVQRNIGDWWPSEREFAKVLGNGLPEMFAACDPQTITALLDRAERAEKALRETVEMLEYLWAAEDYNGSIVHDMFYDDDPLNEDVPKVIAAARRALESAK